jgi:[ribosomal protein S5]-alanine N-acetyltransferase
MTLEDVLKNLPTLETDRLILRKLRLEDAEDMFEYAQDTEIARLGLWQPFYTLQDSIDDLNAVLEGYAQGNMMTWAMEHKEDRKMIGRTVLGHYEPGDSRADLGYAMNRRYWGKGYATEAIRGLVKFGFETMQLNRVGAVVLPENIASIRVLEKAGLKFEGVRREFAFIGGKYYDLHCYSILKREWA